MLPSDFLEYTSENSQYALRYIHSETEPATIFFMRMNSSSYPSMSKGSWQVGSYLVSKDAR